MPIPVRTRARRLAARLRASPASDLPVRLRQAWVAATDPAWRPPTVPDGPMVWPGPLPAISAPELRWHVHGSAIPHDGEVPDLEDPRSVWEVTRLQHVARRALAGDLTAVAAAVRFVDRWPAGVGPGWAVALEVAARLVSLALVATVAGAPERRRLREAVAAHAAWIARHPSRGSSANNHRVAELGALALAGRALDQARWRDEAQRELPGVLRAQLHADGVGVEQSPTYLAFDLEWALLARRCGVTGLDDALDRGSASLVAITDAGGHVPRIGDDDGGRVLALDDEDTDGYVTSVAGAARITLGRAPPPAWRPDLRFAVLADGSPRPAEIARSVHLPDGGLTVVRSARAMVVVDHGPLGGCTLAAHGHADAASVWVHLDGAPLVVDRGTSRYHPDGAGVGPHHRRFDRGTGAHPTLVVDGRDQSVQHPAHPFLWRSRAACRAEHVDLVARRAAVVVEHADGVVHRRAITLHDDRLVLVDECTDAGPVRPRHVAVGFPLDPALEAQRSGDVVVVSRAGVAVAELAVSGADRVSIVCGGPQPGVGWHAVSYGVLVPATAIVVERWGPLPAQLRTELRFR